MSGRTELLCAIGDADAAGAALAAGHRFEGIRRAGLPGGQDAAVFARVDADPPGPVAAVWPQLDALTDDVVTVRPMTAGDWRVTLAEHNNDESLRWSFTGLPISEHHARAEAERAPLEWLVGPRARFVIADAPTGAGAGTLYLVLSGPPGVALAGYGVLPEFRGRGFTARALELVATWVFARTAVARIELGHKVANVASGRAAERAGFVREAHFAGRLRNRDGSYADELYYGRTR